MSGPVPSLLSESCHLVVNSLLLHMLPPHGILPYKEPRSNGAKDQGLKFVVVLDILLQQ
jgi:hypothetical protein